MRSGIEQLVQVDDDVFHFRVINRALCGGTPVYVETTLENNFKLTAEQLDKDQKQVLEAYRMFANSRGWLRRMEEDIQRGLSAEAAVEKEQSSARNRLEQVDDAPVTRLTLRDLCWLRPVNAALLHDQVRMTRQMALQIPGIQVCAIKVGLADQGLPALVIANPSRQCGSRLAELTIHILQLILK